MNQVLPEDVLRQILVRLPVKTLLRFLCVSKTWCDLFKSPNFIDMHLTHAKNHTNNRQRVLLVKRYIKDDKKTLLSFHSHQDWEHGDCVSLLVAAAPDLELPSSSPDFINLHGTCNGIFCIAEMASWMTTSSDNDKIYLCNPATRQFFTLPPSPLGCPDVFYDINTVSLGFGFDPCSKDYKVVRFFMYGFKETMTRPVSGVEIYELRTNSWRRLHIPPQAIIHPSPNQNFPALLNGSLMHWCATCFYDWWHGILSFNICTDAFQKIVFPCDLDGCPNLAVLDDSLAFVLFKSTTVTQLTPPLNRPPISVCEHSIDIWVMMEYGIKESWIKKFSIEPFSFIGDATLKFTTPLSSWNSDILLLESDNGHLISCSLHNRYCREFCKYDIRKFLNLEAIVYEETLVSLGEIGKCLAWRKM